jgi:hypothetical protein
VRDVHGNIYCYRNCPVAYQAREKPKDAVQRFQLPVDGDTGRQWLEVSLFAIPSYHPALSTVVHVFRKGKNGQVGSVLNCCNTTDRATAS